jgi:hypothetical protein
MQDKKTRAGRGEGGGELGTLFLCRSGKDPKGRLECRTRRREQGAEEGTLFCSLGRPVAAGIVIRIGTIAETAR